MSSSHKSPMVDPLNMFLSSAEAEDLSNRAKLSAVSVLQKHAQTMSRIGAPASDLFAENLSFGDPLSRLSGGALSTSKVASYENQNTVQSRQYVSSTNLYDERNSVTPVKLHQNNQGDSPINLGIC